MLATELLNMRDRRCDAIVDAVRKVLVQVEHGLSPDPIHVDAAITITVSPSTKSAGVSCAQSTGIDQSDFVFLLQLQRKLSEQGMCIMTDGRIGVITARVLACTSLHNLAFANVILDGYKYRKEVDADDSVRVVLSKAPRAVASHLALATVVELFSTDPALRAEHARWTRRCAWIAALVMPRTPMAPHDVGVAPVASTPCTCFVQ
jgi:hypothetical protein